MQPEFCLKKRLIALKRYEKIIKAPEPFICLPTGSPIWKIKPDTEAGLLALELRDVTTLQVKFGTVDLNTGNWEQEPFALKENWRISLAGIRQEKLLLHGFGGGAINQPKGLTLVEAASQKNVWQLPGLAFYNWTEKGLLASNPEQPELQLVETELITGQVIRQKINLESGYQEGRSWEKAVLEPVYKVPGHHPAGSEFYQILADFIALKTLDKTVYPIDYLEHKSVIVLAYYTNQEGSDKLAHWLLICDKETGAELFRDCLNTETIGIAPENFFIFQSILFYVQKASCLLGLKLI